MTSLKLVQYNLRQTSGRQIPDYIFLFTIVLDGSGLAWSCLDKFSAVFFGYGTYQVLCRQLLVILGADL